MRITKMTAPTYFPRFHFVVDWRRWTVGLELAKGEWYSIYLGPMEFVWFVEKLERREDMF